MKNKKIISLFVLFLCVAVIGVGFAAWVITNTDTKTAEGTVTVDTITDKRVSITLGTIDGTTRFGGMPESTTTTTKWLSNDAEGIEDLELSVIFTVAYVDNDDADVNDIKYQVTSDAATQLANYTGDNGYITIGDISVSKFADGQYKATLTFGWGSKFGSENPYDYYNGLDATDTNFAAAKADLSALAAASTTKITFTIKASVNSIE